MDSLGLNRKESEYEKPVTFISAHLEITKAGFGIDFAYSENPQRAALVKYLGSVYFIESYPGANFLGASPESGRLRL